MDKEPFEVFLTQEQSKYINEQLPRGYSLQFSTSHARRIQLDQSVSKSVSKQLEKEELKKVNIEQKQSQAPQQGLNQDPFQRITGPVSEDMTVCHYILQQLKKNDNSGPFLQRVDPEAQQCLDYYKVIKNPMDLSKVEYNLKQGRYQTRKQFCDDTALIWRNSFIYNKQGSAIYKMTEELSQLFQSLSQQYLSTPTTLWEQSPQDSAEMNKRTSSSMKGDNTNKTARSIRNDMPLSQEAKNWIYKNVGRLSPEDTSSLCTLVKDYCKVNNEVMELNMDSLSHKVAGEVFDFIALKLPHSCPPNNPYSNEFQEDPKKKIKVTNQINDIPLTILEKKQLGFCIRQLPPEDLCGVWNIIQEGEQDTDVIEFDIDTLPVLKARTLESFVREKIQLQAKKQRIQKQVTEQIQQQNKQQLLQQSQGIPSSTQGSLNNSTPSNSNGINNIQSPPRSVSETPQQRLNYQNNERLSSSSPSQTTTLGNIANQYYPQGSVGQHSSPASSFSSSY